MFAGGIADKLGNRYEAKWLVRQFFDVLRARADWVRFEGIDIAYEGFEFAVCRDGAISWHQTKVNSPNGNWTLAALDRENILSAFKRRFEADENDICVFVSQDPAKDLGSLAGKASIASNVLEFEKALGNGLHEKLEQLLAFWNVEVEIGFEWLRRTSVRTVPQSEIELLIETYAELYFADISPINSFAVLRDFLEDRFNKKLTTESARLEIVESGVLSFKHWDFVPTLQQKLTDETDAYLETYSPFGAGGQIIQRSQSDDVVSQLLASDGPTVVLLTGVAGSGKSGVVRGIIEKLRECGTPHLALRIDQYLSCSSSVAIGDAVLGRKESPATTLKGLFPEEESVLIIDQVDAISEVSGRNGVVRNAILRLVDDARIHRTVKLVLVCRSFDFDGDSRLKSLKGQAGVVQIDVPLLRWDEDVEPLLSARGISTSSIKEKQKELLCLPLNLAIFVAVGGSDVSFFSSRNDLFERLLEKKDRLIRQVSGLSWEAILPLSELANWMSDRQRLDAPRDVLSKFSTAADILASEGLIIQSKGKVNFFHESFFDYIYARSFATRDQSLIDLLHSTEQHLFRRTQVRQILETLRQSDFSRYARELSSVLSDESVRFHIKIAVAKWVGTLPDPTRDEERILLSFDQKDKPFGPLIRSALLSSLGWFDRMSQNGWIEGVLNDENEARRQSIFWWLSESAGERPDEVAILLEHWWGGDQARGRILLDRLAYMRRSKPDRSLALLCEKLIRAQSTELFDGEGNGKNELLMATWIAEHSDLSAGILKAIFDSWFDAHPNHHPFERDELKAIDTYSLGEMAKKSPRAFLDGTIDALVRSVDIIQAKKMLGEWESSFERRSFSGHHFGSDEFLHLFRSALVSSAHDEPEFAECVLARLDPTKHEVITHLYLEAIAANPISLGDYFMDLLRSPFLFDAGWDGAEWKSFSDCAKKMLPKLSASDKGRIATAILADHPEIGYAIKISKSVKQQVAATWWENPKVVISYLNRSGFRQLCILEAIGESLVPDACTSQWTLLRRKFPNFILPTPDSNMASYVASPIDRAHAGKMTDAQWLKAIEEYNDDDSKQRKRGFHFGGARQLAGELQHFTKEQPNRFSKLLLLIPDDANVSYIQHILWGLSEVEDVEDDIIKQVVRNAHARPGRPYGHQIASVLRQHPKTGSDREIFEILTWYIEHGEVNESEDVEASNLEREVLTLEKLLQRAGGIHISGNNGARGWGAEALESVLWKAPESASLAWQVVKRRVEFERLVSVRCCLVRPLFPLFNQDRVMSALIFEGLCQDPNPENRRVVSESLHRLCCRLAFPSRRVPAYLRRLSYFVFNATARMKRRIANFVERGAVGDSKWLAPAVTYEGTRFLPYILYWVPSVGRSILVRLLSSPDEAKRVVGGWHVLRESYDNEEYAYFADSLIEINSDYRSLAADLASQYIFHGSARARAEAQLSRFFDDDEKQVRVQAASVFHNIESVEFFRYYDLAKKFLESRAFGNGASFGFFHALERADCDVSELVIRASERLLEKHWNIDGRDHMDFHQLQDLIRMEYAASESKVDLRRRLLDLIDSMLLRDVYGVEKTIEAHER